MLVFLPSTSASNTAVAQVFPLGYLAPFAYTGGSLVVSNKTHVRPRIHTPQMISVAYLASLHYRGSAQHPGSATIFNFTCTVPGIMSHLFPVMALDVFDVLLGVHIIMSWNSVSPVSVVIVMMSSISATGVGAL
jgi:hypothetical protein